MPGPFTHIYEARRVADFLAAQGAFVRPEDGDALDGALLAPAANAAAYAATMQKWPKFTSLGVIGPDLFFFLADFHQPFDDALMLAMRAGYEADAFNLELDDPDPAKHPSWNALADVFRTHGQAQAANLIDAYATLMPLWRQFSKVWQVLVDTWGALASEDLDILSGQLFSAVGEAFSTTVKAYLAKRVADVVAQVDFLAFFSLGLQKGVDEKDFFWSDMLHYRRTSEMAATLFTRAKNYNGPDAANRREQLQAYALGYACHVATDVAGHPFVNEQCGGPFRTHWQRHHMVENHIDAWNYRETKPGHSLPRDAYCGATDDYPELCQSALYFAVQLKENDAGGDLRRPLPPVDRNLVPAPGDPKGLTPQQRRLRTDALDTDGDMPEWLAVEILRALLDTYGADARAKPPLAPLNLKGFAFQTDVVEPVWHDDYTNKYGLSAATVPRGFPLPWQIQVSYKFMLSYFKRGFMDGFDLPKPRPPQAMAAHAPASAVTGTQLASAVADTRAKLQELSAGIAANAGRIKADLNLPDDTYLADAQAALRAAMNAFDGAVGAMQALSVFVDSPVRVFFDAISLATLQFRMNLYNGVTVPMWMALRSVREDLVQRGFLTPQDAEFLPDGTQLHDTEIDRRHVQLGYTGAPVPVTVETGYDPVYVASQSDGSGTWSGGFTVIGGSNGRRFTVGTNGDGRLEAFAIGTDGVVHHAWQDSPNGSWGGWSALTPIFNVDAVDLAVTTNLNGRLEVFALGADYGIYHTWQMFANSFWSPGWQRIGPVTAVGVDLAAGIGARDLLNALVVGTDGNVYSAMQTSQNGTFSGWNRVGDAFADKAVRVICGRGAGGALGVVVVDERGGLHASAQSPGATSFSLFAPLVTGVPVSTVRGAVACATDGSGTFSVAACGINGELFVFARPAGGSFGAPAAIHTPKLRAVAVALAPNADGTLEAVALAADSTVWSARNASGAWSAWQQVGNPWDKGKSVRLVPNHDGRLQAFVDGVPVSTEAAVQGSRNPQAAAYPFLPVDDEFTLPSAYPDRTRTGAPNALEMPRTTGGPFARDTLAHALLRTDGPADNDARRLYEQAQTPHQTDCLNEQFVGHGDAQRSFTNPLGSPVLFSAYLIGRLNGAGPLPANFNLDSDRAYGYLCWDWTREAAASATGANGPFAPPLVWPRVQPNSKIVGGTAGVWGQAAAAWQKQGGDVPLKLHYVSGPVPPPPDASASPDTCTPLGSLAVAVVPAAIPVGQPVTVTITATDDRSGHPAHAWVVINGKRVARAGTAFTSTFNGDESVVVTAYGYASAAVALPFNRMRITVAPAPAPLGTPVQLTISAADARSGGAVPGATVLLTNFDAEGDAAGAEFPAGVPYPVVLRAAPGTAVAKTRFNHPEKPFASVRASGYADTDVPFTWTTVRPPPKHMTVTVTPAPITAGVPVSVTVHAVDAASGAAVTGSVLITGAAVGTTGTPFSYTFGASAPEAHVTADGYADAPIAWPPFYTPTLKVTLDPAAPEYGKPVQLVVRAVDARSGAAVPGTVTLMNYGIGGAIVTTKFPTNTAYGVTLRLHRIPAIKGKSPDIRYPTLTVAASGYASVGLALGDTSDA